MAKQAKFYETSAFKKLNSKWSKKLKQAGFDDIEQAADYKSGVPDGNLKQWASSQFVANFSGDNLHKFIAKEEYYRLAGQFLHEHPFGSADERYLWEMHSNGDSIDTIVASFKAKHIYYILARKINRRFVHFTIRRLADLMIGKLTK